MTLDQIEKLKVEFLDIETVAAYLGKNPQPVRQSIRAGVPWAYVMGNADFKIPRRSFVFYHRFGSPVFMKEDK